MFDRYLSLVMGGVIVLNVFTMVLETDFGHMNKPVWTVINSLFVLSFTFEIGIRMYLKRCAWFFARWNWFDAIVTLLAGVDVWILSHIRDAEGLQLTSVLRVLRLSRLVRLIKLMTLFEELYIVLTTLWHMLQTMALFMMIMFFFFLVFSLFMVDAIGRNKAFQDVRFLGTDTTEDRFGTVIQSMYSLFELMTLEGWTDVYRPIVNTEPWFALFFSIFIMAFSYGALNVVIALVIERALKCRDTLNNIRYNEGLRHKQQEINDTRASICSSSELGIWRAKMSYADFQAAMDNCADFRGLFKNLDSSLLDIEELFTFFDMDDSGHLSMDELFEGLATLDDRICVLWHILAVRSAAQSSNKKLTDLRFEFTKLWAATEHWNANASAWQELQGTALNELVRCLSDPKLCGDLTRVDDGGSSQHQAAEARPGSGPSNGTACTASADACSCVSGDTEL